MLQHSIVFAISATFHHADRRKCNILSFCFRICRISHRSHNRLNPMLWAALRRTLHIKHYILRNVCRVSLVFTALHAKCPSYVMLYMQSVLIIYCFICKVSLLFSALCAKCPYYVVLYNIMQSVLII